MQAAFSGGQIIQSVIALRKVQECNIMLAWPYAEADREASAHLPGTPSSPWVAHVPVRDLLEQAEHGLRP